MLVLTSGIGFSIQQVRAQQKPHIILIMADQHRGDALGCMGNSVVISPNIDRLSVEGTLFCNGYSSTPSSTPARAGLLTGMSPWHHGMLGYGKVAAEYKYEMPAMLREQNYYTFGIGKMHWSPQKSLHGFHGTLIDESGRADTKDFISDYRLWLQVQRPGVNPDLTGIGWNEHRAGTYKLPEELHPTAWTGKMACELIQNYNNESPLFLKVSFARPHSPYDPPQRLLDEYEEKEMPAPYIGDWCSKYATPLDPQKADKDAPFANFGAEYAKNSRKYYYANVTFIDEEIGKIIQTLKDKGMYDNALICYVSDHGDMLGDHYHWRKTYPYEGSTHVPYIVKWPESFGIKEGIKVDEPVELRDLLPTFLDASGAQIPEEMDGLSLLALVDESRKHTWRQYIDLEHATCYAKENYWCALTDGKIKYVWNFYTGEEELFDLKKDPGELQNLVSEKHYRKRLADLREAMVKHLSERGEGFVKEGKLVVRKERLLYSPNYPKSEEVETN